MIEPLGGDSPGDQPYAVEPPLLTGQRRVLVEALSGKSAKSDRAIQMYVEALRAIQRNDGPEALHVAAYELRSMMDSLPAVLDLPVVIPAQLRDKVQRLAKSWTTNSDLSACRTGADWRGELDEPLKRFMNDAAEFFKWVEEYLPRKQQETAVVLQRLLPADFPMPRALIEKRTDEWKELVGYFNSLTHHNEAPVLTRFRERLDALETFLLEHLAPRTFEDQDEIDRLVREAEAQ